MKNSTVFVLIKIFASAQIFLALVSVGFFFWAVSAHPSSETGKYLLDALHTVLGKDQQITYELVWQLSFGPILYTIFAVVALLAASKKTRRWIRAAFFISTLGSVIGVASSGFPVFQIALSALFFAEFRKQKADAVDHSQDEQNSSE